MVAELSVDAFEHDVKFDCIDRGARILHRDLTRLDAATAPHNSGKVNRATDSNESAMGRSNRGLKTTTYLGGRAGGVPSSSSEAENCDTTSGMSGYIGQMGHMQPSVAGSSSAGTGLR